MSPQTLNSSKLVIKGIKKLRYLGHSYELNVLKSYSAKYIIYVNVFVKSTTTARIDPDSLRINKIYQPS